jgi:hypothetical protein
MTITRKFLKAKWAITRTQVNYSHEKQSLVLKETINQS